MYLYIDAGRVPPAVEVRDPGDFTSLSAVVVAPSHLWLDPAGLAELAGRTDDEAWHGKLASMIAYAGRNGWLDEHGHVRAHVEVQSG